MLASKFHAPGNKPFLLLVVSINKDRFTMVFVASSSLKYFDAVFTAEVDTMRPVLFVD